MTSQSAMLVLAAAALVVLGLRVWLGARSRRWIVGRRGETTILVRRRAGMLELVLADARGELVQSRQDSAGGVVRGYVDGLHVGMLGEQRPTRILFVGGGACVGPRQFEAAYRDAVIDVVENEPLVIDAARRHFGLVGSERLSIIVADAERFLADCPRGRYDLVVLDAYDAHGIPVALAKRESVALVRRAMTERGSLVVNVATNGADEVAASMLRVSVAAVFSDREIATFELEGDPSPNTILLVAPNVPDAEALARRADRIAIAPMLPEIVRRRVS